MPHKTIRDFALIVTVLLAAMASSNAETIRIVALGASNANGKGVGSGQAWPAQLESMLRSKGYDVSISVSAINGDTSAGILSRVDSAVPAGTRIVVFDSGYSNDLRRGSSPEQTQANIAQIRSRIQARGAVPLQAKRGSASTQGDGIHYTVGGHTAVAASLVPQVIAAIGKRK